MAGIPGLRLRSIPIPGLRIPGLHQSSKLPISQNKHILQKEDIFSKIFRLRRALKKQTFTDTDFANRGMFLTLIPAIPGLYSGFGFIPGLRIPGLPVRVEETMVKNELLTLHKNRAKRDGNKFW